MAFVTNCSLVVDEAEELISADVVIALEEVSVTVLEN
jgi:hypothetical protein